MRRRLPLLLLLVTAPLAAGQDVRVVASWDEPVKHADGTEVVHRVEIVYDYARREALQIVSDGASGARLAMVPLEGAPQPSNAEIDDARAIIHADPELAAVIARLADPVVEGGFLYYEGECAASRCLQFVVEPRDGTRGERFVVVDLANRTIVERDLYPELRD